ncbi:pyridoxamine 5'-phosphate oxidase family protein [Brevibacillus fluminis]|uniref:Pyridoxamine 5'-phosphate oxidase family protein n=1 Tax=Brevibacillus fluminis TaxID=511487 RepID=A0A3M8DWX0_9BACL|nr:pyridoxamine 5'-phosphate oxidase family protein [Brevibacillus fluminis]RNB92025.1 pyridoxamine 5'-phosphate oxidase family protein [Brevibacillus fluminis]
MFKETVSTEEELRSMLGYPSELVQNKVIHYLDEHCRDFIAKSPFLAISTSDHQGLCDVSPRGDSPGFVLVLDDKHLVIPERPGNRRIDSMKNILSNPNIGLIFIIPGLEETLRINGRACLVRDEELLAQMEAGGRTPMIGIGVEVQECYVHCAKAFKRSKLWDHDSWLEKDKLPRASRILADHAKMAPEAIEEVLKESYTKRLY